jgi:hypothetical protein
MSIVPASLSHNLKNIYTSASDFFSVEIFQYANYAAGTSDIPYGALYKAG